MRMKSEPNSDYTKTWSPSGEIEYAKLADGTRLRYLKSGAGPALILLHTARTQLDQFQLVIPKILQAFTVYAIDMPGMGWSDITPGRELEGCQNLGSARNPSFETLQAIPTHLSSPTIRRYPQCGFSWASRKISVRSDASTGGRPGFLCGYVQRRATSWRCQRSSVSGLTGKPVQDGRGSERLSAASSARSARVSVGRACRRRTASSWRRTRISNSFERRGRASNHTSANRFRTTRYTNDQSKQPSPDHDKSGEPNGPDAATSRGRVCEPYALRKRRWV
jgi:hypothetical protein